MFNEAQMEAERKATINNKVAPEPESQKNFLINTVDSKDQEEPKVVM